MTNPVDLTFMMGKTPEKVSDFISKLPQADRIILADKLIDCATRLTETFLANSNIIKTNKQFPKEFIDNLPKIQQENI